MKTNEKSGMSAWVKRHGLEIGKEKNMFNILNINDDICNEMEKF